MVRLLRKTKSRTNQKILTEFCTLKLCLYQVSQRLEILSNARNLLRKKFEISLDGLSISTKHSNIRLSSSLSE